MGKNALEPLINEFIKAPKIIYRIAYLGFDSLGNILYRIIEGKPFEGNSSSNQEQVEICNTLKYKYEPLDILEDKLVDGGLIKYKYIEGEKEGVKACIGCDIKGEKVWFDVLNGHTLVGGASRWGKSSFLNVLITTLMLTYTEREIAFMGCDFKRSDVYYYGKYKHFRGSIATNPSEFMQHMLRIEKEMLKREQILNNSNCRNVIKYNKVSEVKLSYIIYVIDELPLLTSDKACTEKLRIMLGKSASYGVYFILATQDATKETIGKCKMNCSQTVGFHTKDETDSITLIGDNYLKDIKIKGRCFIDNGTEIKETQIFFLEEEEIEDLIKDKRK